LTTFFCCHHPVWWIRQRPGHRANAERDRFKKAAQAKPEGLQNVNVRIRESEALPQLVDEYLRDRPYLVDAMPTYLGMRKPYRLTRDYIRRVPHRGIASPASPHEVERGEHCRDIYCGLHLRAIPYKKGSVELSWIGN
jgi:hypothetical protein